MENGTKHRILYLYQHLLQHTDAEHPLSTAELMKILKEQYAIKVSRNTISDDLLYFMTVAFTLSTTSLRRTSITMMVTPMTWLSLSFL